MDAKINNLIQEATNQQTQQSQQGTPQSSSPDHSDKSSDGSLVKEQEGSPLPSQTQPVGTGKYDAEIRENKLEIINTFGSSSL